MDVVSYGSRRRTSNFHFPLVFTCAEAYKRIRRRRRTDVHMCTRTVLLVSYGRASGYTRHTSSPALDPCMTTLDELILYYSLAGHPTSVIHRFLSDVHDKHVSAAIRVNTCELRLDCIVNFLPCYCRRNCRDQDLYLATGGCGLG